MTLSREGTRGSASSKFWFVIGRALGTVVVTLHGDLDRSGAVGLHDALDDLINNQGNMRVAVDLRSLRRIDPSCASLFLAASNWARRRGGSFTVHRRRPALGS